MRPSDRGRVLYRVVAAALLPTAVQFAAALGYPNSVWPQTIGDPRRIAEGPRGQVLLTDRRGTIVAVDKESLQPVWSHQLPNEGAPFGLAVRNRLVYVGNTETMSVEAYRMQGLPDASMKLEFQYNLGYQTGLIKNPISIAADPRGGLVFVLDGKEKQIKIFDEYGAFVTAFFPADQSGKVLSPVSVAVNGARREILVGDYGDPSGSFRATVPARILIYTFEGNLLFQINGDGSTHSTTRFARVQGIAAARDGRIFASDPLGARILVLDRTSGALIGTVGAAGDQPGQLMLPLDVFVDDKTGDVFVVNNAGARRVEVFRRAGS